MRTMSAITISTSVNPPSSFRSMSAAFLGIAAETLSKWVQHHVNKNGDRCLWPPFGTSTLPSFRGGTLWGGLGPPNGQPPLESGQVEHFGTNSCAAGACTVDPT